MKYNGIIIADQHFGASDSKRLLREHNDVLFDLMDHMDKLDYMIILGDFFDHKMYLNDTDAWSAYECMKKIVFYVKKFNAKLRIVYGTASHENNQYHIFDSLFDDESLDISVVSTVSEEELFSNFKVLYIPEEYIHNKKEYYSEFFTKKKEYNYVFGHGIIQEVMTNACRNRTTSSNRVKVPTFTTAELSDICKGEVYFGHYHIHSVIASNIHYVGSFSRWKFGEEEDKGFYLVSYDDLEDIYTNHFIRNTFAARYNELIYDEDSDIYSNDDLVLKTLSQIDESIQNGQRDKVKIKFILPKFYNAREFFIDFIKGRYDNNPNIKFEISEVKNNITRDEVKKKIKEMDEKFNIIFDKSISLEEKIKYYIETFFGEKISTQDIDECLGMK